MPTNNTPKVDHPRAKKNAEGMVKHYGANNMDAREINLSACYLDLAQRLELVEDLLRFNGPTADYAIAEALKELSK